jgi:hypothetical protein
LNNNLNNPKSNLNIMKNAKLYKVGALCLTFLGAGAFMAFDDAQTDEQKVEAAYEQLVADFKLEQDQLCKTQALAAAQEQFAQMSASVESSEGGNDAPASTTSGGNSDGSSQPPTPTTTTQGGNSTPPPPPPPKEEPKPTAATKGGANQSGGKVSGKGGATKTGDNKSVSTKGGATKK